MSLNATLKELVDNSKKITSIELSTGSPEITDYLLQKNGAKRRLIRDAESQECKLFAISSTESISARIQADLGQHSQSRTTTRRTNIDRILSAANILNQLCNLEDAKTRIEKLAQTHEERQLNVDYLESALKKSESDMEALLNDARNAPSSGDSNVSGSVDEELRRTQVAVEMLENRLQVLKDKGNELQEQIDEQHRLQTAMQQMTQRHTNNDLPSMETMFETEMKTLEEKVASKRKELSDYGIQNESFLSLSTNVADPIY
ncbi:uncharacterized protein BYT42DRAFT_558409 [Radiomyces spectabilis]|uniref:uncharacterized protein n=1 Tax=Radiomyces spectabilis TaxID=64574 RepID=UPI00221EFC95|nr:uncharacterized protein BYT42DRAFT_558409 [Radiomyces spectabilis]KAI8387958.1 hypothetical protein BYT42DRAFT_558409 [Radiomyces spectabilis]